MPKVFTDISPWLLQILTFSLLSQIIAKLKKGETVDDAEVEETTQV